MPTWKGTDPQKSRRVSRNCEERLENENGSLRYLWMETTRKSTIAT